MASGVHSVYPQIPPAYPQHTHSSSMNGSFSQPMGSFDASQSVASTPAPTPPPPRPGSQQQIGYGMNGGHTSNGMMPPNNYGGYPDPNVYSQPQYYDNGVKPQIYTAVYSNVSVFEMEVNGVAVMRRRADSWLNATQILKVAGVDKGKRTKVLEKEVQSGEHEKVQGGYGKYQGTWINYQRGRQFCRQYGVEQLLLPLLEHDIQSDGLNTGQTLDTPTKEQAMAAQRKRMYGGENRSASQSTGGTFFKNMSTTAANAINALNRTRVDSPSRVDRRSMGSRRPSQPHYSQDAIYASQQSLHSVHSQDSFNNGVLSQGASFADFPPADGQEPPRKRIRPSPSNSFMNAFDPNIDMSMQEGSPTEPSHSFYSQQGQSFSEQPSNYGLEPLPHPSGELEDRKKEMLLDLFIDPTRTDFDDHPAFLRLSGDEFEVPIDESCNTALHWAATLARVPLLRKLLDKGFNMRRANSGGETALIAACRARNNLDQQTFPALLELLGSSIEVRDGRGRTVLHHIAVSSAMKGRAAVGKYYLDSLLEHVLNQGNAPSSSQNSNSMTLARFMSDIVNAQDKAGDTALNIAARTSTTAIIDQLIEVGADPSIENRGGLAPVDFGVKNENGNIHREHGVATFDTQPAANNISQNSFEDAHEGLLTSIRDILSQSSIDFSTEVREKQEILDKTNAALKESGSSLAEERKKLEALRGRAREKDELEQKISNLRRSTEEQQKDSRVQSNNKTSRGDNQSPTRNVILGEADKGLDFDGALSTLTTLFPQLSNQFSNPNTNANSNSNSFNAALDDFDFDFPSSHSQQHQHQQQLSPTPIDNPSLEILSQLESPPVLTGRIKAYRHHNDSLTHDSKTLRGRSIDLEERYKRIVHLCTGVPEAEVDGLLDSLVQAVISEQKDVHHSNGNNSNSNSNNNNNNNSLATLPHTNNISGSRSNHPSSTDKPTTGAAAVTTTTTTTTTTAAAAGMTTTTAAGAGGGGTGDLSRVRDFLRMLKGTDPNSTDC